MLRWHKTILALHFKLTVLEVLRLKWNFLHQARVRQAVRSDEAGESYDERLLEQGAQCSGPPREHGCQRRDRYERHQEHLGDAERRCAGMYHCVLTERIC